uniref:Uncharacterized protein n=1 Tax=Solanum tuberosum TaxID=4113 RepID=M1CZ10_SOLTU
MVTLDSGVSFVQSKPNSIMDAMHISLLLVICFPSQKRLTSTTSIILPENDSVIHFLKSSFPLHISSSFRQNLHQHDSVAINITTSGHYSLRAIFLEKE